MLCQEKILENLEHIDFKDDILQAHPSYKNKYYRLFIRKEKIVNDAVFDTTLIIGTEHPDYKDKSWIDCLNNLKHPINLSLLRCDTNRPSILYYTDKNHRDTCAHDPWTIDIINDKAYITQGNHRSIISRFLSSAKIIPKEQFGLDSVKYVDYDQQAERRYYKLLNWFETLPDIVKDDITFKVTSKLLSEKDDVKEYTTVYKLETGYCYHKYYDQKYQKYDTAYTSFLLFKQDLFYQVRHLLNKHKYRIQLMSLFIKLRCKLPNR